MSDDSIASWLNNLLSELVIHHTPLFVILLLLFIMLFPRRRGFWGASYTDPLFEHALDQKSKLEERDIDEELRGFSANPDEALALVQKLRGEFGTLLLYTDEMPAAKVLKAKLDAAEAEANRLFAQYQAIALQRALAAREPKILGEISEAERMLISGVPEDALRLVIAINKEYADLLVDNDSNTAKNLRQKLDKVVARAEAVIRQEVKKARSAQIAPAIEQLDEALDELDGFR